MSLNAVGWLSSKIGVNISGRQGYGGGHTSTAVPSQSTEIRSAGNAPSSVHISALTSTTPMRNDDYRQTDSEGNTITNYFKNMHSAVSSYWNARRHNAPRRQSSAFHADSGTDSSYFDGSTARSDGGSFDDNYNTNTSNGAQHKYPNNNDANSNMHTTTQVENRSFLNVLTPHHAQQASAHARENNEVDEQGLPVSKNWYIFDTTLNRWTVSADAPESIRHEYEHQLKAEEDKRLGLVPVVAPPPVRPPSSGYAYSSMSAARYPAAAADASGSGDGVAMSATGSASFAPSTVSSGHPRGIYPSGVYANPKLQHTAPVGEVAAAVPPPPFPRAVSATGMARPQQGKNARRLSPQYAIPSYFADTSAPNNSNNVHVAHHNNDSMPGNVQPYPEVSSTPAPSVVSTMPTSSFSDPDLHHSTPPAMTPPPVASSDASSSMYADVQQHGAESVNHAPLEPHTSTTPPPPPPPASYNGLYSKKHSIHNNINYNNNNSNNSTNAIAPVHARPSELQSTFTSVPAAVSPQVNRSSSAVYQLGATPVSHLSSQPLLYNSPSSLIASGSVSQATPHRSYAARSSPYTHQSSVSNQPEKHFCTTATMLPEHSSTRGESSASGPSNVLPSPNVTPPHLTETHLTRHAMPPPAAPVTCMFAQDANRTNDRSYGATPSPHPPGDFAMNSYSMYNTPVPRLGTTNTSMPGTTMTQQQQQASQQVAFPPPPTSFRPFTGF